MNNNKFSISFYGHFLLWTAVTNTQRAEIVLNDAKECKILKHPYRLLFYNSNLISDQFKCKLFHCFLTLQSEKVLEEREFLICRLMATKYWAK